MSPQRPGDEPYLYHIWPLKSSGTRASHVSQIARLSFTAWLGPRPRPVLLSNCSETQPSPYVRISALHGHFARESFRCPFGRAERGPGFPTKWHEHVQMAVQGQESAKTAKCPKTPAALFPTYLVFFPAGAKNNHPRGSWGCLAGVGSVQIRCLEAMDLASVLESLQLGAFLPKLRALGVHNLTQAEDRKALETPAPCRRKNLFFWGGSCQEVAHGDTHDPCGDS